MENLRTQSSDQIIQRLKDGNSRFSQGRSVHPNTDPTRIQFSSTVLQEEHAFAAVLSCADSRLAVERIFDVGIMDIFTVRNAGNLVGQEALASLEFALDILELPVLVIMGHTQCGLLGAVAQSRGKSASLPGNLANLEPLVNEPLQKASSVSAGKSESEFIHQLTLENIFNSAKQLESRSPGIKKRVQQGKLAIKGALYHMETGKVQWLNIPGSS